jgi:hypothetical protein
MAEEKKRPRDVGEGKGEATSKKAKKEKKVYKAYEIGENEEEPQIIAFSGTPISKPQLDAKTDIKWCTVNFDQRIINGIFFKSATEIVPCDSLFDTAEKAINDYENRLHQGVPGILFRIKYPNYPIDGGKVRYKLKKKKSLQKGKKQKSKRVKKKKTKKLLRKQTRTRKK